MSNLADAFQQALNDRAENIRNTKPTGHSDPDEVAANEWAWLENAMYSTDNNQEIS